jgi:hypothetical protein
MSSRRWYIVRLSLIMDTRSNGYSALKRCRARRPDHCVSASANKPWSNCVWQVNVLIGGALRWADPALVQMTPDDNNGPPQSPNFANDIYSYGHVMYHVRWFSALLR